MKRFFLVLSSLIVCLCLFAACSDKAPEETTATTQPLTTQEPTTQAEDPANMNLLTGKPTLSEKAIGKRPVAVMINNIRQSLPQYGIAAADILFEVEVEGGITRMMAVYGDYTAIPDVCSIRSCRYYFPIFAASFDAIYCCYGSNKTLGTATLQRLDLDYFDGEYYADIYGRDQQRLQTYSMEHTAYLKGSKLPAAVKKEGMRSALQDKTPFFRFYDEPTSLSAKGVKKAVLNFSDEYFTTFEYSEKTKKYKKTHNGTPHMDESTEKQLSFTNILILTTSVTSYDGSILRKVNWKGGNGYLLSNGTMRSIKWSKADEKARFVITDLKGNEISLNRGKSYIGVLNPEDVHLTVEAIPEATTAATSAATTAPAAVTQP